MRFQDILLSAGIALNDVNLMLHSPREREFAKVLPTLVHTRRAALDQYQSTHSISAGNALKKGRPFVAVFVKVGDSRLVFAGLYRNMGWKDALIADVVNAPEAKFLYQTYGIYGEDIAGDLSQKTAVFDLVLSETLHDLVGRLVISALLTPNYVRLAENFDCEVLTILEKGIAETPPPPWRTMTVSAAFLRAIPQGWAALLSQWRGVYLITDMSDGAQYVGSAYGDDINLLGRWLAHVEGDVGQTAKLKARNPINFQFSILERTSPDLPAADVIALEHTWMRRLHTTEFGLNS